MILAIFNLYVAPMPPIKFQLNPSYGLVGEVSFEEFQYGRHGSHLGYRNGTILAILNLYVAPIPPIKFRLNLTYGWEEISFEEFQDGHCGEMSFEEFQDILVIRMEPF